MWKVWKNGRKKWFMCQILMIMTLNKSNKLFIFGFFMFELVYVSGSGVPTSSKSQSCKIRFLIFCKEKTSSNWGEIEISPYKTCWDTRYRLIDDVKLWKGQFADKEWDWQSWDKKLISDLPQRGKMTSNPDEVLNKHW